MVICKFFLQGTCKFGDTCKFEHQLSDHNYGGNSSILLQNYAPKPQTSNVDTNTLVKAVVNDMTSAEKGGQWLLSSYAPFKEKPAFPGFEDHSMEEVRYLFYESVKSGNIEIYKQTLQTMLQQAMMKIKALQSPSLEAVTMLKTIYDTPASSSLTNQTQFNANSASNSVFGGSQPQPQQQNFGNSNPTPSIFGGGNNTAQQQNAFTGNTKSIFGNNQPPGNSLFGQPPSNQNKPIFGGAQPSGSIFGSTAPPPFPGGTQSIFGQPPQNTSPFAPPNQTFSQQNIFQQSTSPQNQFGATNPTSPFGNNQTTPSNPFGAQTQNFGTASNTQINQQVVPSAQGNKPAFQHTQSIFGNLGLQTGGNVFGGASQSRPNEEFYSKLEELSEEEIKWFQSDDLDITKIPEKPPTYEMCFKV